MTRTAYRKQREQLYLRLVRTRTGEAVMMKLEDGLKVIKEYDDKQRFMNMLGQEEFWKKNRLILWKQLNDIDDSETIISLDIPKDNIIYSDFITTDLLLKQIGYRLESYYHDIFNKREENILDKTIDTCMTHRDDYNYNHTHGRYKSLRTRCVSVRNLSIRHSDMEAFQRDVDALYKKYAVQNPDQLKKGKRYYSTYDLSKRMVRLYYKL
jgi:hypothetical protein